MSSREPHTILGVSRNATKAEIDASYQVIYHNNHPNRCPSNASSAQRERQSQILDRATNAREAMLSQARSSRSSNSGNSRALVLADSGTNSGRSSSSVAAIHQTRSPSGHGTSSSSRNRIQSVHDEATQMDGSSGTPSRNTNRRSVYAPERGRSSSNAVAHTGQRLPTANHLSAIQERTGSSRPSSSTFRDEDYAFVPRTPDEIEARQRYKDLFGGANYACSSTGCGTTSASRHSTSNRITEGRMQPQPAHQPSSSRALINSGSSSGLVRGSSSSSSSGVRQGEFHRYEGAYALSTPEGRGQVRYSAEMKWEKKR